MIEVNRLDHLVLTVKDIDKRVDFYTKGEIESIYLRDPEYNLIELSVYK